MSFFDRFNKVNDEQKDSDSVSIISANFEQNTCIIKTTVGTTFVLPIEILIADVMNEMGSIKDLGPINNWPGFSDTKTVMRMREGIYPDDYFYNLDNYVKQVELQKPERIYQFEGADVASAYKDSIHRIKEEIFRSDDEFER